MQKSFASIYLLRTVGIDIEKRIASQSEPLCTSFSEWASINKQVLLLGQSVVLASTHLFFHNVLSFKCLHNFEGPYGLRKGFYSCDLCSMVHAIQTNPAVTIFYTQDLDYHTPTKSHRQYSGSRALISVIQKFDSGGREK